MPQFPDFIPAKRPGEPNFTQAAIYQGAGDRAMYEQELAQREQQLRGPVDAYKGYVNLTDHNPLADQVRKWTGGSTPDAGFNPSAGTGVDPLAAAGAPPAASAMGSNAGIKALSMTDPVPGIQLNKTTCRLRPARLAPE